MRKLLYLVLFLINNLYAQVDIDFFSEQLMSKNNVKRAISYYMDEDSILDTINIIQSHFDKKGRLIEHIEINQELIKANFVQC